ncbi:hypothetical protein, variant [Aphanomyces astaci]|uniref:Uncharacterized protein n=1 Tax=Aphanomyces astaci TaxID=112090 RepID=W4FY51_APHAT|nr:hypothetical protein, variant [Aphanomyces astaci]ETV71714.1 hypothetical protein, variant [Aphanomyces astaci]|eukprot:XP_009838902.1 hypothetical protein, variant [Aphanomyces astaci]
MDIPHHSAQDHYEFMLETFKSSDRAQRLWGTGSEEEVTEQVQLLQDLVDRREVNDQAKKAKKEKDPKRRDSMESTESQLCLEAEQRVAKRQRTEGLLKRRRKWSASSSTRKSKRFAWLKCPRVLSATTNSNVS